MERVDDAREAEALRILVVDDEDHIVNFLRMGLTYEGFVVEVAGDAERALDLMDHFKPHLVVLDLMLPGMDGLELAERLRRDPELLIIMLTARDQLSDRVTGLTVGADDYIVKPFDFEELLARIRAVARRRLPAQNEVLRAGPITLDQPRRVVTVDGRVVDLTVKEYELLRLFLLQPRRVLPRQLILDRVWGYNFYGQENNVEVYVGYLRRKLGDEEHRLIETVRGVGYRLNV
ncbi:MAG: response regulator transcription factor [Chloroflexi bacterium]|nr:response regulator transcription factor [Chloroflexota bacterium]